MTVTRVARIAAFAFCLLLVSLAIPHYADTTSVSPCDEAILWLLDNSHTLPATLEDLIALPSSHRRRAWAALSPQVKSDIAYGHYSQASLDSTLSNYQRQLLSEAATLVTPDLFALDKTDLLYGVATLRQRELAEKTYQAFTAAQWQYADFLSTPQPPALAARLANVPFIGEILVASRVFAQGEGEGCSCGETYGDYWCAFIYEGYCDENNGCNENDGCGIPFYPESCIGQCCHIFGGQLLCV